jgi:hypothetical protein
MSNPNIKDYGWKSGQSGNPNGRPSGSRNIRTNEVLELIKAAGHQDPLITLSELQAKSSDEAIRATAANMLAPYLHSKNASKPIQPDPIYILEIINLQEPKSIAQATENISRLSTMKAQGLIDFATADNLINDMKIILYALLDENKLIASTGDSNREQVIRIEGGLPLLPGTNVIMPNTMAPKSNGHDLAPDLSPDEPVVQPAPDESQDPEPPANSGV